MKLRINTNVVMQYRLIVSVHGMLALARSPNIVTIHHMWPDEEDTGVLTVIVQY